MAQRPLGNLSKGMCFVISAPAGTGKTTLVHKLIKEFSCVSLSISSTTRPPRLKEVPGKDYIFMTVEEFEKKIEEGDFLEHAKVFGNYYGTSRDLIEKKRSQGMHVVLVIDTQGACQLRDQNYDATYIFVSPPNLEVLMGRLVNRKTESQESIDCRMSWARQEMAMADFYDYHIINDDLEIAYDVLRSILIAEEHKLM